MFSLKRRRIVRERQEAVGQRVEAVTDLVTALREVEDAMARLRAANGRFYHSNFPTEQGILNALRREREGVFVLKVLQEIAAVAPKFAQLLRLAPTNANHTPLIDWIHRLNWHDLRLHDPASVAAKHGAQA